MIVRELRWKNGDEDVLCRVERSADGGLFRVGDKAVPFRFLDSAHLEIAGRVHRFFIVTDRDATIVWIDGHTHYLQRSRKAANAATAPAPVASGEIRALMPGKLLQFSVAVGDSVVAKQNVGIMESMKMESSLVTPISGRVSEIRFKPGEVVEMGDVVVVVEPAD
jgi:biotin carboxyl carrier protein